MPLLDACLHGKASSIGTVRFKAMRLELSELLEIVSSYIALGAIER